MARVIKEYEARRKELITAAWSLFMENGYENTTVNAIIDECDVSKGTFYHYFDSKEQLLEASIEQVTVSIKGEIDTAISQPGLDAIQRMTRLIDASRVYKTEHAEMLGTMLPVIYREENLLLRHKMNERSVELISPAFTRVIEQGVDEGVFDVEFPRETSEMILRLGNAFAEANILTILDLSRRPEKFDLLKRRVRVYETTIERILGAPEGAFDIFDERSMQLLKKLASAANRMSDSDKGI